MSRAWGITNVRFLPLNRAPGSLSDLPRLGPFPFASQARVSQAVDCINLFILFSRGMFMLGFSCCFLYAMESLLVRRNWGR